MNQDSFIKNDCIPLFIENSSLVSSKHLEIAADFSSDNQLTFNETSILKFGKKGRMPFHKDD